MGYKELYEAAQRDKAAQVLTPAYVSWETEGQMLVGKLISMTEVKSGRGEGVYLQYVMETDDGVVKFALGGNADRELAGQLIAGRVYAISYLGKQKLPNKRQVNRFRVERVPSDLQQGLGGGEEPPF